MDAPAPRWLTVQAAAVYCSCTPRTLVGWALPRGTVVRIARRGAKGVGRHRVTLRVDRTKLDEFLSGGPR
jgi:hypothetical protein